MTNSNAKTLENMAVKKMTISLAGPGAVVSYPLMVMAEQQLLAKSGITLDFIRWKNPEQLRAMVIGKQVDFTAMPSNLAATFYNRGHHLGLVNISIWNIMSIVSRQSASINSLADLLGQEIVVPFKNDMPSIVLQQLLQAQLGDQAELVRIRYSHNLADAAQLLLANKVKHALLIEPLSSVVLYQNRKKHAKNSATPKLSSAINISEQWQKTFPQSPKLPQAGIVANTTVRDNRVLITSINQAYKRAALWCANHTAACADVVRVYLPKMPKPALIAAINATAINVVDSKVAQSYLEKFYSLLAETDPKRIGNKLPADEFYL